MATILTKKSDTASAVPLAADLTNAAGGAELAVNATDKRLFSKTSGGTVVELGTNPSTLVLPSGSANGVAYLNGSKVVTSGSALTFDGTALGVSGTVNDALSVTSTATTTALKLNNTNANGWGSNVAILTGGTAAGYFGTIGSLLGSTAQDLTVYATASNGFRVYTNGNNERMRVTSGGDVGIGTSSITGGYKLQVNGNLLLSSTTPLVVGNSTLTLLGDNTSSTGLLLNTAGNLGLGVTPSAWAASQNAFQIGNAGGINSSNSSQVILSANRYYANSGDRYINTAFASLYQQVSGQHQFYTAPSGTAGNAITFTQAMTLDASGNLTVGATSNDGRRITASGNTNDLAGIGITYLGVAAGSIAVNSSGALTFNLNNSDGKTERARIDSSGIFYSPPTYANTTATAGNMGVAADGAFYRSTSALKYKQDIRNLESMDIGLLRPVRYKSKCEGDDQTKDHLGLIADEAAEAGFEELVTRGENGEVEGFQYERLTVVLLKELQTLRQRVAQLEAQ